MWGMGVSSYRCNVHGNWPCHRDFQPCPECDEKCSIVHDSPMDMDEARSRLHHARFYKWLEKKELDELREELEKGLTHG